MYQLLYYEYPGSLEDATKICLEAINAVEWIELSAESEQPLRIPTEGDTYTIALVNPRVSESVLAGVIRLFPLENITQIFLYEHCNRLILFVEILLDYFKAEQ